EKYLQALVGDIDIPQEAYQKPQLVVKEVPAEVLPVQPPVPTPAPKTLEWQPPQEVKKVQKKYFEDVEPVAAVEDSFEFDLPFLRWR
ncbi:MAG: hypothetical protein FWD03_08770, partial [Defluviitaleaceae bacterium]|nr:hypothetical protein [Defluviitaleaceae bacterium]